MCMDKVLPDERRTTRRLWRNEHGRKGVQLILAVIPWMWFQCPLHGPGIGFRTGKKRHYRTDAVNILNNDNISTDYLSSFHWNDRSFPAAPAILCALSQLIHRGRDHGSDESHSGQRWNRSGLGRYRFKGNAVGSKHTAPSQKEQTIMGWAHNRFEIKGHNQQNGTNQFDLY